MNSLFTSERDFIDSGSRGLEEKMSVVNACIERIKSMRGRSSCPCCGQDVVKASIEDDFKWFSGKKAGFQVEMERKAASERPAVEAARASREAEDRARDAEVDSFVKVHEKEMLAAIKAERTGKGVFLPEFRSQKSKSLWNDGMRVVFKTRKDDILEYDGILYEIG